MNTPDETSLRTVWTVGHSTRDWPDFVALLTAHRIALAVDVRSHPGSRRYPQFGRDAMAAALPAAGVAYRWMPGLGGRRRARADSPNTVWRHPAFRGYADYMDTPDFAAALTELEAEAATRRTAYFCSEAVWWRCHRGLISDALKARGWTVLHIVSEDAPKEHPFTPAARLDHGRLTYREPTLF